MATKQYTPTAPTNTVQLAMKVAMQYVEQMIESVQGSEKLTPAQQLTVRLHVQAQHNELFKSLVLMPIDNKGTTLTAKYGLVMSAWVANHALRQLAFGRVQYSVEVE